MEAQEPVSGDAPKSARRARFDDHLALSESAQEEAPQSPKPEKKKHADVEAKRREEELAWAAQTQLPPGYSHDDSPWLTEEPEWAKQRRVYLAEKGLPKSKRRVEAPRGAHHEEVEAIMSGAYDTKSLAYAQQGSSAYDSHHHHHHGHGQHPKLTKGRSTQHIHFDEKTYEHPEVCSCFALCVWTAVGNQWTVCIQSFSHQILVIDPGRERCH